MRRKILLLFSVVTLCCSLQVSAQNWAIKTNLVSDATASMNLGVEVALAQKWTLDLSGTYNPFTFSDNMKWKHWLVQPEFRYWLCRKFSGHFFALHLQTGVYNFGGIDFVPDFLGQNFSNLANRRFEGYFVGAGLGYGYAWALGKHWNLEAEIGIGGGYTWYDKFICRNCGRKLGSDERFYWGITKVELGIAYIF